MLGFDRSATACVHTFQKNLAIDLNEPQHVRLNVDEGCWASAEMSLCFDNQHDWARDLPRGCRLKRIVTSNP